MPAQSLSPHTLAVNTALIPHLSIRGRACCPPDRLQVRVDGQARRVERVRGLIPDDGRGEHEARDVAEGPGPVIGIQNA